MFSEVAIENFTTLYLRRRIINTLSDFGSPAIYPIFSVNITSLHQNYSRNNPSCKSRLYRECLYSSSSQKFKISAFTARIPLRVFVSRPDDQVDHILPSAGLIGSGALTALNSHGVRGTAPPAEKWAT